MPISFLIISNSNTAKCGRKLWFLAVCEYPGSQLFLNMDSGLTLNHPKVNSEWIVCISCDGQEAYDSFYDEFLFSFM